MFHKNITFVCRELEDTAEHMKSLESNRHELSETITLQQDNLKV